MGPSVLFCPNFGPPFSRCSNVAGPCAVRKLSEPSRSPQFRYSGPGMAAASSRNSGSRGGSRPNPLARPNEVPRYGAASMRPLHILVFLLPLMAIYEIGSILYLTDPSRGVVETIGARGLLGSIFEVAGAASFHLPPLVLGFVLLLWHAFVGDPWRVKGKYVGGMWLESIIWTVPLIVFAFFLADSRAAMGGVSGGGSGGGIQQFPWQARMTLAVGAGLYEELLFRLILITVLHTILVDAFKMADSLGFVVAAVASSLAFAFYHNVTQPGGGVDLKLIAFFTVAGLYFASLFIVRGFGIAVATHALYDVFSVVIFPAVVASGPGARGG